MSRYLVISAHTAEDCEIAVKYFRENHASFLSHFGWGCFDNDHNAYAMVEADSHEAAKMIVPPLFRAKTRVIKLSNFDPKKTSDPMHQVKKPATDTGSQV